MKNGIKLTRKEKVFLSNNGYSPEDYLRVKKLSNYTEFLNVRTNKILKLTNEEGL